MMNVSPLQDSPRRFLLDENKKVAIDKESSGRRWQRFRAGIKQLSLQVTRRVVGFRNIMPKIQNSFKRCEGRHVIALLFRLPSCALTLGQRDRKEKEEPSQTSNVPFSHQGWQRRLEKARITPHMHFLNVTLILSALGFVTEFTGATNRKQLQGLKRELMNFSE